MSAPRHALGHTLFEVVLSLALIAVFTGVFLQRALVIEHQAERAAVAQTVAVLRTALPMRFERLRQAHPERAAELLAAENPMTWLNEPPRNYLGEYYSAEREKIPHGNWVFDRRDKTLVYFPAQSKSFTSDASTLLKFKVKFTHLPQGNLFTNPSLKQEGMVLEQVSGEPLGLAR